jgi:RNA polymerase sigma factor (sigma-70 family)
MKPDDATLVLACRQGDQAAWDALVTRYERLVYAIAYRAGLDQEQATDIYQRVFTILVERLDSIERPAQIAAWLISTTQHEAWRLKRRARTAGLLFTDADKATDLPDNAPPLDDWLLLLEEQQRVRAAVAALPERCRQLIEALFFQPDPPTYAEIAAALGVNVGSIGPTRARCLQKLRQLLGESEG